MNLRPIKNILLASLFAVLTLHAAAVEPHEMLKSAVDEVLAIAYRGDPTTVRLSERIRPTLNRYFNFEAITRRANTGKIGDGKIFVMDLETALRIRTGEADAAAISG
jgi:hypothetical protein